MARDLLNSGKMMTPSMTPTLLSSWLETVSAHIQMRRFETRTPVRASRNRERERARREARQLFATYHADRAMAAFQ